MLIIFGIRMTRFLALAEIGERCDMDSRKRTFLKAILWNLIGLAMMAVVGIAATGSAAVGGVMALVNTVIGLAFYILYERLWSRISWGRADG